MLSDPSRLKKYIDVIGYLFFPIPIETRLQRSYDAFLPYTTEFAGVFNNATSRPSLP